MRENSFWQLGCERFNSGQYWHAHEDWEQGWKILQGKPRHWVQGCIQAAAVLVHLEQGRNDPAFRLANRALELMSLGEESFIRIPGVDAFLREISQTPLQDFSREKVSHWLHQAKGLKAQMITEA